MAETVTMEGRFGLAEIDKRQPAMVSLRLRQPDGTLAPRNLLSAHPPHLRPWAVGG